VRPTTYKGPGMRVTVICEGCGFHNRLERQLRAGETAFLICHNCEAPLGARWSKGDAPTKAVPRLRPAD